jgi:hypothetical protein
MFIRLKDYIVVTANEKNYKAHVIELELNVAFVG